MGMTKIITPGAWNWNEPQAQLVKVSSRGLIGADAQAFVKRASVEFLDKMAGLRLMPGEIPVHLLAVGATEYYNANRNGDGFREKICQVYHPTFVKLARWFRDHDNKDTAKGRGIIKLSCFNPAMHRIELLVALNGTKEAAARNRGLVADEEMECLDRDETIPVSMACWTNPDYPILTKEHGYIPVETVRVNMTVWTKQGRWKRVTQVNRRKYTGEVFEFHVNGLPFPAELTAEHPMWAKVFEGSRAAEAVKVKARRYFKNSEAFASQPAAWAYAKDIGVGDRFFYQPITRYAGYGRITSKPLAAVMGYYTAEGSFGYNGDKACTTQFSCNLDDSLPRILPGLVEQMYPDITVDIHPHHESEQGLVVEIHNTPFSEFLRKWIGAGCKRKVIPPEIFNSDREIKLSYLGRWLDGDGWPDKKGIHWSTASVNLVLQGRDLLASIGIPASIYMIDHAKCPTSGKPGSGIEYTLNVSHVDAWQLAEYSEKVANYKAPARERDKPATMRRCPDGTYALRIKEIKTRFVSDVDVYNFEVEDDESYSAAGLISHNCRVSHDVCSGCGNKARTRAEYCGPEKCAKYGGLRDNIARTFEDGHTLHADNPDPNFFDISKVWKNADYIAFTLGKAAAYEEHMQKAASVGGAALAERFGCSAPLWLMDDGPWTDAVLVGQLKVAQALIEAETRLNAAQPEHLDRIFDPELQRPAADLPDVRKGAVKLAHVLAALSDQKCMLPLTDFLCLLSGEPLEKIAGQANAVAERLPGVFTRLSSDPRLETCLRTNPYRVSGPVTGKLRHWVAKHASQWSLDRSRVVERLQRAVIRSPELPPRRTMSKIAMMSKVDDLAKEYCLYQLGFLEAHRDAADAAFLQDLVVRSNLV